MALSMRDELWNPEFLKLQARFVQTGGDSEDVTHRLYDCHTEVTNQLSEENQRRLPDHWKIKCLNITFRDLKKGI
jgi:hypothetical protein